MDVRILRCYFMHTGTQVTVQPYDIPRVKSLCERFCELCKRQNATLEHFVCIRRDSEAEG